MNDRENVLLACHEFRCGWDHDAPVYEVLNRLTGTREWVRNAQCLRGCGSIKTEKFRPDGSWERLRDPDIVRPSDWDSVGKVYFSAARRARLAAYQPIGNLHAVGA
jgi:hypothetical protein